MTVKFKEIISALMLTGPLRLVIAMPVLHLIVFRLIIFLVDLRPAHVILFPAMAMDSYPAAE